MSGSETGPFHVSIWATAERLIGLRRALTRWAGQGPLSVERQEDLVLATYEAMANSAEHAYPDHHGGPLEVTAVLEDDGVRVVVADEGCWRPPDPTERIRGRGRALIARRPRRARACSRRRWRPAPGRG